MNELINQSMTLYANIVKYGQCGKLSSLPNWKIPITVTLYKLLFFKSYAYKLNTVFFPPYELRIQR